MLQKVAFQSDFGWWMGIGWTSSNIQKLFSFFRIGDFTWFMVQYRGTFMQACCFVGIPNEAERVQEYTIWHHKVKAQTLATARSVLNGTVTIEKSLVTEFEKWIGKGECPWVSKKDWQLQRSMSIEGPWQQKWDRRIYKPKCLVV